MSEHVTTAALKVLAAIDQSQSGCWIWMGGKRPNGYGRVHAGGKSFMTHRVVYEHFRGPIPEGLHMDHLCRVRACVNPAHLEPVTCRVNVLRGETLTAANLAKTHCPEGHPYDEINTFVRARGSRECRECMRARGRRRRARLAEEAVLRGLPLATAGDLLARWEAVNAPQVIGARRCHCNRPVPTSSLCGCCCAEHDQEITA